MKRILSLLLSALLAAACVPCLAAAADGLGVAALVPEARAAQDGAPAVTPLYCGPTQGAYRHGEAALDPGAPYVLFGQSDCWSMVAQGTPEAFGPVGWVETAALDAAPGPELAFPDALPVMIEEDAFLTDDPLAAEPARLLELPRGAQVTLLACWGDWGYAQYEADGAFLRAFFPLSAI